MFGGAGHARTVAAVAQRSAAARERYARRAAGRLVAAAAAAAGLAAEEVERTADLMLGCPPPDSPPTVRSELNWNGSPLQLLLSLRAERTGVRLLADPGFHHADVSRRRKSAGKGLRAAFAAAGAGALLPSAERMLDRLLPADKEGLEAYAAGSLWLALALGAPGAAVYAGPDPRGARWPAARACARALLPPDSAASSLIDRLEPLAFLLGVGLEGRDPERARLKIYWRLARPAPLSSFGIGLFEEPAILAFLAAAIGEEAIAFDVLNFSAAFNLAGGALVDVKIDVGWHGREQAAALSLIGDRAAALGLDPSSVGRIAQRHRLDVGCVGLGLGATGDRRLNVYLFQP